jgi:hypothetical protein
MRDEPTLEVTYRHGRPWAAYLFLPRLPGQRPTKSRPVGNGMVVDLGKDGTPLGVEITAPRKLSMTALNAVLKSFGVTSRVRRTDLAPLLAA